MSILNPTDNARDPAKFCAKILLKITKYLPCFKINTCFCA